MDKISKIVGIVVVAWIALSLAGWAIGAVFDGQVSAGPLPGPLFWTALVAGGVWAGVAIANRKNRSRVGYRR